MITRFLDKFEVLNLSSSNRKFKMNRSWLLMVPLLIFAASCGTNKKVDEDLQKAYELHEKSVGIRSRVDVKIHSLFDRGDSIAVIGKVHLLDSIKSALSTWDEQMIEVPGFEDEHDHSGHDHTGHDHNHSKVELTPVQHLEVQQHLLEEIQAIANKLDKL